METGLYVETMRQVEARLMAQAADRAATPGKWTGGRCLGGGHVDPDALASMVSQFGAIDVIWCGSLEDGEIYDDADYSTRQRLLDELLLDSDMAIQGMEQRSHMFKVDGRDIANKRAPGPRMPRALVMPPQDPLACV
jgi:hypothetical protein